MQFIPKNKQAKKLTLEQVGEIRRYYAEGATQGELCKYFKVSIGQIGRIVRGESWVETAGEREASPREMQETAERLLALQQKINSAPQIATMAEEFERTLKQHIPRPSPLDGGGEVKELEGLTELEERARAMGVDIEKLRKVQL